MGHEVIAALTVAYLSCFVVAAAPAIARIVRRRSSADCSLWREWFVLAGVAIQLAVFVAERASWPVLISPIASGVSIGTLIAVTLRFR